MKTKVENEPKDQHAKLTDKEEETMLLLWDHGPCGVKDLMQYYSDPKPHINTVSTFVRSLEAKGYVGHEQGRYGSFNYFALCPKQEYRRSALGRLVERYFGSSFSLVSQLVKEQQLDSRQLRELLDMVEDEEKKTPEI